MSAGACNCIGPQNGQPRCPCMMGRRSADVSGITLYSDRINPVGANIALHCTKEEGINERLSRWTRTIEDVLIEISKETDDEGLLFWVDVDPVVCEVDKVMNVVRNLHKLSKENPSAATMIPGNPLNEE